MQAAVVSGTGGFLLKNEKSALRKSKYIVYLRCMENDSNAVTFDALENGARFLADYLARGNHFRINYPLQNLEHTRFKLIADMEAQ